VIGKLHGEHESPVADGEERSGDGGAAESHDAPHDRVGREGFGSEFVRVGEANGGEGDGDHQSPA
jgi:hypothetical protein